MTVGSTIRTCQHQAACRRRPLSTTASKRLLASMPKMRSPHVRQRSCGAASKRWRLRPIRSSTSSTTSATRLLPHRGQRPALCLRSVGELRGDEDIEHLLRARRFPALSLSRQVTYASAYNIIEGLDKCWGEAFALHPSRRAASPRDCAAAAALPSRLQMPRPYRRRVARVNAGSVCRAGEAFVRLHGWREASTRLQPRRSAAAVADRNASPLRGANLPRARRSRYTRAP
jgi:hypothetical protein